MKNPFLLKTGIPSNILFLTIFSSLLLLGCGGDSSGSGPINPINPPATLVETFQIDLSAQYSIPANTSSNSTGMATLELFSDNSLKYTITMSGMATGDVLTTAHIHLGDLVSTGIISMNLVDGTDRVFNGNTASGSINISDQDKNILQGEDIYLNVHSNSYPGGLARGSIDEDIDFAMDIDLSPNNNVPPLMGRGETGTTFLRLSSESVLYYKININDLDMNDALIAAHIHTGMADETGPVFQTLAVDSSDFEISKSFLLNEADRMTFLTDYLYVNVHTDQEQAGLMRGQIR